MIRKKWIGDKLVGLESKPMDEFCAKSVPTGGSAGIADRELADQIGLMEDETITEAEVEVGRFRRERLET